MSHSIVRRTRPGISDLVRRVLHRAAERAITDNRVVLGGNAFSWSKAGRWPTAATSSSRSVSTGHGSHDDHGGVDLPGVAGAPITGRNRGMDC